MRILSGAALPSGWIGKGWARDQLARAAAGEYLLFTDADTVHAPGMLAAPVGEAARTRASLLSLWPRQITGSLGEKAVIPLLIIAAAQASPRLAKLFSRSFLRSNEVANGQFLLFRPISACRPLPQHAARRAPPPLRRNHRLAHRAQ